ncbi:Delta2-dienoyl-CoA-isomerase [Coprinopsis sp. MPI-PUGE-AT-0042]|nr:Delta2-dienoyl-CoA-isomerase [Coprinopsis sp. MPI-PUGE-AT-0042]
MSKYSSKWLKVSEPPPVNAFSTELSLKTANDVRAAVLSSEFPKIFTAGLDLHDASALGADGADTTRDGAHIFDFQAAITFPVIAATHGHVIGLGVDMTAVCDIRLAASNSVFAIKEVDIGLAADIGSLAYLPKITGNQSLLRELAYTGRYFNAQEAKDLGVGGKDEVVQEALKLAQFIASKSPVAVAGSKVDHSVKDNLEYTAAWNAGMLMTDDIAENLRATQAKQKPWFAAIESRFRSCQTITPGLWRVFSSL